MYKSYICNPITFVVFGCESNRECEIDQYLNDFTFKKRVIDTLEITYTC